jgi:hypothetical protein
MNPKKINTQVIGILSDMSDDGAVRVTQRKHIKVMGIYSGEERSFCLAVSPSSSYQNYIWRELHKFVRSLN